MDEVRREIRCVVKQIRAERETRNLLSDSHMPESRKEQIIEKRKGEVRRRYGCSMDDSLRV